MEASKLVFKIKTERSNLMEVVLPDTATNADRLRQNERISHLDGIMSDAKAGKSLEEINEACMFEIVNLSRHANSNSFSVNAELEAVAANFMFLSGLAKQ